jgi:uncharacterized DUF497 family protein
LKFEWREANLQAHGVSFDLAKTVFEDPFAIERLDDREDYGEERFSHHWRGGKSACPVRSLHQRDERIRIISARRATQREQDDYFRQNT